MTIPQKQKGQPVSLEYRIFRHSYLGFNSNSILFYGERDAVLVDASQLLSDSHRMAAEIITMRRNLTHIYVSHFHPDHHFGLGVLQYAFPEARIVALPSVARDLVFVSSDKVEMWSNDRMGPDVPRKSTFATPLSQPYVELEGEELRFSDDWEGDSVNNSVVWVPSLGVLCASDVAFHDAHLWTAESNVERRVKWRAALNKLREFDARVIIPGHCSEQNLTTIEDVKQDGSRHYTDCLDWSVAYLDAYEDVYNTAKTGAELVAGMTKRYPDVRAVDFGVHWQARMLFPKSSPEWLTQLPGEPGEIFLNPDGKYDGDPPRE